MFYRLFLMMRSILFFVGQAFMAIFVFLIGFLLFPFPYIVRYRFITLWSHFVIWWAKVICGIHYQVQGKELLPKENGIILCNHQSAWETLFLQTLLPPQTWVLKKQLLTIPFFGWGLAMLEPIAIDRSKSSSIKQLLNQGKKLLSKGRWVIIFPEGQRRAVGENGKFSRSGAVLAKESGYKIVPLAHNAGICWPRNAFIKKPGTICVVIGPYLDPKHLSADEIQQKAQSWIESTMKTLPHRL
ncbi:MAG: 1-acyl-sn-glycerol-3-phosphate acyltransferase [Proteobacteria bacterium]|nr:1-acyl-sn-glycerol-3-phosphate acyltransferase [Pseudomonadota bacterium]